jgi:hypothetical protein
MTASELKYLYESNNSNGHYFDYRTMLFFGDTMHNFGVRDGGKVLSITANGIEEVEVWELYRKRPVRNGLHGHCRYFSKKEGQEVFTHSM